MAPISACAGVAFLSPSVGPRYGQISLRPQGICPTSHREEILVRPAKAQRARVLRMAGGGPARSTECDTPLKKFLDDLKPLGKTRIIAQNGAAVMESISTWDGLFFATIPKGEYANLIDPKINLDMHLLLKGVGGARFENGISRSASKAPTYIIRMLGEDKESVVLSVFLQWDKEPEDIGEDRVAHWKSIKDKYGDENGAVSF